MRNGILLGGGAAALTLAALMYLEAQGVVSINLDKFKDMFHSV
jgi:hypothetical protein